MIELPWPPSVNHYWFRARNGRVFLGPKGRAYKQEVAIILRVAGVKRLKGAVGLSAVLYPPDRRRRDIDNILKALLDALDGGGAFGDDSQIKRLAITMMAPKPPGSVEVTLEERDENA